MEEEVKHTHDGESLTFGCQACIDRVQRDQRQAELDEAPERPISIEWIATAIDRGTVVLDAKYLHGEKAGDVAERISDEIHEMIAEVVDFPGSDWDWEIVNVEFDDVLKREQA